MRRLVPALLAAACAAPPAPGPDARAAEGAAVKEVWLDVDPAIGLERSEVDDGLALIQSLHAPELRVRGVSVVFGNTTLEKGVEVARDLVERFGPPGLPVLAGAASDADLGKETAAVEGMVAALEERPMTLLALGPVTNVATLVDRYPQLHSRIEAIVMVAARRPGQRFSPRYPAGFEPPATPTTPHRDFNFELDPAGMEVLLRSDIELVFAPWEVSSHVWIRRGDLEQLRGRSEVGAWVADACASWVGLWEERFGIDGFNPFDTLAVAWLTHPQLVEAIEVGVKIEVGPDDREPAGSGLTKAYLQASTAGVDARPAVYCYRPRPELKAMLLDRLVARPPSGEGENGR